jgi:hypothetical protein
VCGALAGPPKKKLSAPPAPLDPAENAAAGGERALVRRQNQKPPASGFAVGKTKNRQHH